MHRRNRGEGTGIQPITNYATTARAAPGAGRAGRARLRGMLALRAGLWAAAVAAAFVLTATSPPAQEPEGWAYDLANQLMSPYCPGRTLAECPSPQADTLRMWLIVQETAGRDRAEVEAELIERFGDAIRAAPRPEGFGLAAYLVPVLVFLAGGVLVGVVLRRFTRVRPPPAAGVAPSQPLDPELERQVDEELAR
jgi:cytochrome c-type biogenesis protein CcmH/NrfF